MNACSMSPECGDRLESKLMISQKKMEENLPAGSSQKISLVYIQGFQLGA